MTKNMSRVLVGPKFPFPAGRNAADHRLGTGGAGGDSGSSRGRGLGTLTRQKPGEVPRGRARWPCGAVAAAGPPALDGTGRVGSARTTPGSRGDGPQTSGDLLAVSLSDFRDLRVPGLGWDSAKGGRAPGPGRADPRSVCAPRTDLSPGASPLCVLATRGRVRASGTPAPRRVQAPGTAVPARRRRLQRRRRA